MRVSAWSLALCVAAGPLRVAAAAPTDGQILVAAPALRGVVGEQSEASLRAALRTGLERAQLQFVEATGDARCEDAGCHAAAGKQGGAAFVATLQVTVTDRDYAVRVGLVEVATGEERVLEEGCAICGLEEACTLVESLGARVGPLWQAAREEAAARTKLEQAMQAQPRLRVTSSPAGAAVFVDGEKIGVTPVAALVTGGRHVVELRRDDYLHERREVELTRGTTSELQVDLRVDRKSATPRGKVLVISGAALMGVGVVGVGVMAVGLGRGAAIEREGADKVAMLEADGVSGIELTDALADTRARGKAMNTTAIVGAAIGVVMLATGAVLIGLGASHRMRRVAVAPWGGRGLAGLSLAGRF